MKSMQRFEWFYSSSLVKSETTGFASKVMGHVKFGFAASHPAAKHCHETLRA